MPERHRDIINTASAAMEARRYAVAEAEEPAGMAQVGTAGNRDYPLK